MSQLIKTILFIITFLLFSIISNILLIYYNFNITVIIGILLFIIGILLFGTVIFSTIYFSTKNDKNKEEIFNEEVKKIKSALDTKSEVKLKLRKTTEVEIVASDCFAKIEDGKIKCTVSFTPEEIEFDSIEQMANYFSLNEEE